MTNEQLVTNILELVGGKENVLAATNCMTRLRIDVKEDSKIDVGALKKVEGVLGVVHDKVNYVEIVVGPGKSRKCADICAEMGIPANPGIGQEDWKANKEKVKSKQKTNKLNEALKTVGQIFIPLIPGVIAAGLCAGFASLLTQLCPNYAENSFLLILYQILTLINQSFLLYLTAWAGYRAAEQFGATPILGGMLGMITGLEGINTISGVVGLFNEAQPLDAILRSGRGGVLAAIIGVFVLSKVEKWVRKRMPDSIDIVFTPIVTLLITIIPYIFIVMPVCGYISSGICAFMSAICMSSNIYIRIFAGFLASAIFLPMVAMGMHHGLVAIYSVQLAELGYVTLYPALAMAGAGQVGAAIALYYKAKKMKNERLQSVIKGTVPAGILGVGEPLIYGVTLPLGRPFITAGIGAGFGGAFVMAMQVASTTWGPSGVIGAFVMTAGPNNPFMTILYYMIGLVISGVMAFLITKFMIKDDLVKVEEKGSDEDILAVCDGEIIDTKDIKDEMFAQEMMGKTLAIEPSDGHIYAPASGKLEVLFPTGHAFALRMEDGTGLLVHVGIDTVSLNGKGFQVHKKQGDYVQAGECIVTVDLDIVKEANLEATTMLVVSEPVENKEYNFISSQKVSAKSSIRA